MAYAGYLIKVGGANGTVFPMKYIRVETYKCTPNQRIDQGSDSDATGELHRTVLPHTRTKIEFETPQMLRGADVAAISSLLGLAGSRSRDVTIQYWMVTSSTGTMRARATRWASAMCRTSPIRSCGPRGTT